MQDEGPHKSSLLMSEIIQYMHQVGSSWQIKRNASLEDSSFRKFGKCLLILFPSLISTLHLHNICPLGAISLSFTLTTLLRLLLLLLSTEICWTYGKTWKTKPAVSASHTWHWWPRTQPPASMENAWKRTRTNIFCWDEEKGNQILWFLIIIGKQTCAYFSATQRSFNETTAKWNKEKQLRF